VSVDLPLVRESVESLRRVGLASRQFGTEDAAKDWRAAMRRACRAEHLRIRTLICREPGEDGAMRLGVYVHHMDRVVIVEELSAVVEALPVPPGLRPAIPARNSRYRTGHQQDIGQRESIFMEITRRDDIGTDLKAPSQARGGAPTPGYALVSLARPEDVVIHYDSRQEAIVGVSVVSGPAESAPIYWVARGSYARRAGERPRWLPGIRVPLRDYRQLAVPLTLAQIRAEKDELVAIRARIKAAANGQPIYFPWIPYQDTLRTFQSYLVKMPQEAISLFPQLRAAVEQTTALSSILDAGSPAEQAEKAVGNAAGKIARSGRGQGFQLDQEVKAAVEAYAMNAATEYYAASWAVEDVHGKESYDLVCRRAGEVKHVEVKGTTTDGIEVILTPNEVTHARDYRDTALFVLKNISVERAEDGTVMTAGGVCCIYDPWFIEEGALTPIGYRYRISAFPVESTLSQRT
jgi:hypothetical protein